MPLDLKTKIPGILFAAAMAVAIVFATYFFSMTKISTQMFLTINSFPMIDAILGFNFAFFLICASFPIAIILLIGRKYHLIEATIFSVAGYLTGVLIGIFLFNLMSYLIPLLFGIIGIPFGIKYLIKKEEEYKYLKKFRAGSSAAGRILLVICLGFGLFLAVQTYQNQKDFEKNFVPEMLSMTVGGKVTLSDSLNTQLASAMLMQQTAALNYVNETSELETLVASNNRDGIMLRQRIFDYNKALNKPETLESTIASMKKQDIDLGKELVAKFPMMNNLAKIAWIIYPALAIIICLFFANLIVKNLGALIYWIINRSPISEKEKNPEKF